MIEVPTMLKVYGEQINDVVFSTHVAGTTFINNSEAFLKFIKERIPESSIVLILEREPTNKVDPNAVKVLLSVKGSKKRCKIGYIPADRAEVLSYALEHDSEYQVKTMNISLHGGDDLKPNIGIFFSYVIHKREVN